MWPVHVVRSAGSVAKRLTFRRRVLNDMKRCARPAKKWMGMVKP